jgi:hypothetical protein
MSPLRMDDVLLAASEISAIPTRSHLGIRILQSYFVGLQSPVEGRANLALGKLKNTHH